MILIFLIFIPISSSNFPFSRLISFFFFPFRCTKIHFHIFSCHLLIVRSLFQNESSLQAAQCIYDVSNFFFSFTGILSAQVITVNYASKRRTCERFSVFPLSRSVAIVHYDLLLWFTHRDHSFTKNLYFSYLHQIHDSIIDFVLTFRNESLI